MTVRPGGIVAVPIRAEPGSLVRVTGPDGRELASVTAPGSSREVSFRAIDGSHTYAVTATDAAGNESWSATFTADADGTPPGPAVLEVRPGTVNDPRTIVRVTGEPGSRVLLRIDGAVPSHHEGVLAGGASRTTLLIPSGGYSANVRLTDSAGNDSTWAAVPFGVDVPPPAAPRIERTSKPGASPLVLRVSGPKHGKATITLKATPAVTQDADLGAGGSADVEFPVADGAYKAVGTAIDALGRTSPTKETGPLVIDTKAPLLSLRAAHSEGDTAAISWMVRSEPGATVMIESPTAALRTRFVAKDGPVTRTVEVDEGEHLLTVIASDKVGNETRRIAEVSIDMPASPAQVALGFAILLALVALVWWIARHKRAELAQLIRQVGSWLAARRAHLKYRAERARFERANAAHAARLQAWAAERTRLAQQLDTARSFSGSPDTPDGLKLRRHERVFLRSRGDLVEPRRTQGVDHLAAIDAGTVTITDQRVVFQGYKQNREWAFGKLLGYRHDENPVMTRMDVSNRQKVSGVAYSADAAGAMRFMLELALAHFAATVEDLIARSERALDAHDRERPVPPTPPTRPVGAEEAGAAGSDEPFAGARR